MLYYPDLGFAFFHIIKTGGNSVRTALRHIKHLCPDPRFCGKMKELAQTEMPMAPIARQQLTHQMYDLHTPYWLPARYWNDERTYLKGWDKARKIVVVRNPWDHMVSLYTYEKRETKHPWHHLTKNETFRQWMERRGVGTETAFAKEKECPDLKLLAHAIQSRMVTVDPREPFKLGEGLEIIPYEELNQRWESDIAPWLNNKLQAMGEKARVDVKLDHINVSRKPEEDWRTFYHQADRNLQPYKQHRTVHQARVWCDEDFNAFGDLASKYWFPSWNIKP